MPAEDYKLTSITEEENDEVAPLNSSFRGRAVPSLNNRRTSKLMQFGMSKNLGGIGVKPIGDNSINVGPMGLPRGIRGMHNSAHPMMRKSVAIKAKNPMLRQSIALFSNQSVLIKPSGNLEKETNKRMSLFPSMTGKIDLTETSESTKKKKKAPRARASIFTRIEEEKGASLRACGPTGQRCLEIWYSFYDFWEYNLLWTAIAVAACFSVLNPFGDEVWQMITRGNDGKIALKSHLAVFLIIAKWSAALSYLFFAELVFLYSRVFLGYVQMSPVHMFIPYMAGNYHAAHQKRGWWFLTMIFLHCIAHLLRVICGEGMPLQLSLSGFCLMFSCILISILATRGFNLPCSKERWAKAYLRKTLTWEFMRLCHIIGVCSMMIAAWWHRFPEDESPLTVWFKNRMFWLYMAFTAAYCVHRCVAWAWTVQIDITTHTIYKSCQLIIIQDFPYAKRFCTHGREWFSADAKIMFPDVDSREWHPFTCVVNAKNGQGFILVKNYGNWTSKFTQMPASYIYMRTPPIKMSFEISQKYTNVLVVASGTFITTVAGAVTRAISLGADSNDAAQDITIVWIDREPIMIALVCLRLLSGFTTTNFRIYCTAKNTNPSEHLDEIQLMSTMASTMDLEEDIEVAASGDGDKAKKQPNESDVVNTFNKMTNFADEEDGGMESIIDLLEDVTSEFPNIQVFGGRPNPTELFDDIDPDFLFLGAAPPVAAAYLKLANERKVDYKTSSYL